MIYYDPHKSVSVFSTGKHGTNTIKAVLAKAYKDIPKNEWYKNTRVPLQQPKNIDYPIPYYQLMACEYTYWRRDNPFETNYVVIRDPKERFISGLAQNVQAECNRDKVHFENNERKVRDTMKLEAMQDMRYCGNGFHIGPYLHLITWNPEIAANTVYVQMEQLNVMWYLILGLYPEHKHSSVGRIIHDTPVEEVKEYFAERLKERKFSRQFLTIYDDEVRAYNKILENYPML